MDIELETKVKKAIFGIHILVLKWNRYQIYKKDWNIDKKSFLLFLSYFYKNAFPSSRSHIQYRSFVHIHIYCNNFPRSCNFSLRNWVFSTNSHFLTLISLQPDSVNLWYFKLRLFDLTELIVRNIKGLGKRVAKL